MLEEVERVTLTTYDLFVLHLPSSLGLSQYMPLNTPLVAHSNSQSCHNQTEKTTTTTKITININNYNNNKNNKLILFIKIIIFISQG